MTADDFILFLVQIAVMLACGLGCGHVMRRLHQPAVLGEMLGGILLGPTVFGWLAPELQAQLFPAAGDVALLRGGAIKLGMLFFLFVVGLEIDLGQLAQHGTTAFLIGVIGTLVPLACGVAVVYLLPDLWGQQAQAHRLAFGLFIGAALANTANPVLARILMELGLLRDRLGALLMTATTIDDLMSWSLLAAIFSVFTPPGSSLGESAVVSGDLQSSALSLVWVLLFFAGTLVLGRFVAMPALRVARRHAVWPSGFIGLATILVLLSAAVAERIGVHAFLGPFLLGLSLAPSDQERSEAYEAMNQFVLSFFVPIYFVSMGLTTNFVTSFDFALLATVLVVASVSKIGSVYAAARLSRLPSRISWAVAWGMNARGAIGIILASLGREQGVIDEPTYVALVVMALVTSLVAAPAMRHWLEPPGTVAPATRELVDA
ncbi:MAG: cation:proton antiporter [Pirellulales bacterium]|nr:cation:proton antiporter [Pirellulales bacterium]